MATPKRTVFLRASATVLQADPETIDTEALEASNQKKKDILSTGICCRLPTSGGVASWGKNMFRKIQEKFHMVTPWKTLCFSTGEATNRGTSEPLSNTMQRDEAILPMIWLRIKSLDPSEHREHPNPWRIRLRMPYKLLMCVPYLPSTKTPVMLVSIYHTYGSVMGNSW